MVLSAGEVQRVGCLQSVSAAKSRSVPVHGLRDVEYTETVEKRFVLALKNDIAALDRPDQAFQLDQRRYAQLRPPPRL